MVCSVKMVDCESCFELEISGSSPSSVLELPSIPSSSCTYTKIGPARCGRGVDMVLRKRLYYSQRAHTNRIAIW